VKEIPLGSAIGWHQTHDGPTFVYNGGAIGRTGHHDIQANVPPNNLAQAVFPDPTADPAALREAWLVGNRPLMALPAHIAAPLEGLVWRSPIGGRQPITLHVHGPRGTMKTAICRVVGQHFVPSLQYPSATNVNSNLPTLRGMQRLLGVAQDTLLVVDDFAPGRGGVQAAQDRLAELVRQMNAGSARIKADRVPGTVIAERAPGCSLLLTGEITAGGAAEMRCFNVQVDLGQIFLDLILDLDTPSGCDARALLGASFLMWAASRYSDLLGWAAQRASTYGAAWRRILSPSDVGALGCIAEGAAGHSVGIALQLAFLSDVGAITEAEAVKKWRWAFVGIRAAATRNLASYVRRDCA
jgi:hypothetical protein